MSVISAKTSASAKASHYLGDFTTDPRVVVISAIAVVVRSDVVAPVT